MRKYFISFLGVLVFSMPLHVSAQQIAVDEMSGEENLQSTAVVANINIYDAAITQNGREITAEFEIANEDNKVQPQVRYAIALEEIVRVDENGSEYGMTVDEYVFDEVLSLNAGASVKKKVTYTAPKTFFGEYRIVLRSRNNSGLPFSVAVAGKVNLEEEGDSIYIDQEECRVFIESGGVDYDLFAGVDIAADEKLVLSCPLNSSFDSDITAQLEAVTYDRTIFGEKLETDTYEEFVVASGEETRIEQVLDTRSVSQAYDVELTLLDVQGNVISNTVKMHYVVQGTSATIQNIRLDKDYYQKGDVAVISYDFTGRADFFAGSRASVSQEGVASPFEINFDVNIVGKSGECASGTDLQPSDEYEWKIVTESECVDPKVVVQLKDASGNILDSSEFSVTSVSLGKQGDMSDDSGSFLYKLLFWVIAALLIIVIVVVIKSMRGNKGGGMNVILMLVCSGALITVIWPLQTEALTLRPESAWSPQPYFVVNPSNKIINTCQDLMVTGEAYVPNCANTPQSKIKVTLNGNHFADYYSACHTKWRFHTSDRKICEASKFKGWNDEKNKCGLWSDAKGDKGWWLGSIGLMHGMTEKLCNKLTKDGKYMEWDSSCYMDLTGYKDLACYGGAQSTHFTTVSSSNIPLNKSVGTHGLEFAAQFYRIEEDRLRDDDVSLDWWSAGFYESDAGTMEYMVREFIPSCDEWSACSVTTCGSTGMRTRMCTRADCSPGMELQACNTPACPPCECNSSVNGRVFGYLDTGWGFGVYNPSNFCAVGEPLSGQPEFPSSPGSTSWMCGGSSCSGDPVTCGATRTEPQPCACGPDHNAVKEDAPTTGACQLGNLANLRSVNGQWTWTCGPDASCGPAAEPCSANCVSIEIDAPSNIYLKKNGNKLRVKVRVNGHENIDEDDGGTCNITVGSETKTEVVQSGGSTPTVEFDYSGVGAIVEAQCMLNVDCGGASYVWKEYEDTHQVTSLCMEKSCSAQGTCQGTPKSGVSSVEDCVNTCNSNAECSSGRMIETRP